MKNIRFIRSKVDNYVYLRISIDHNVYVYLLLNIDSMLIVGENMDEIDDIKGKLSSEFQMKDLPKVRKIFGIPIIRDRKKGVNAHSKNLTFKSCYPTWDA